jgi:hypothetical protein
MTRFGPRTSHLRPERIDTRFDDTEEVTCLSQTLESVPSISIGTKSQVTSQGRNAFVTKGSLPPHRTKEYGYPTNVG